MKVYFIGAGPGDPDLITVKGKRLIEQCTLILYAGSLVPEGLFRDCADTVRRVNTATLTFDQITGYFRQARDQGLDVARVHSGDPSIYGAIGEQIRWLESQGIDYEVIPGVTSCSASAAALGRELTLPGISQTVIMTRYAGKTPMPEGESLASLARHRATLVIHLGITRLHRIVDELLPEYGPECPVAVLYRTGWEDEKQITGRLDDIVPRVRACKINRTALIIVGRVLAAREFDQSFLYDPDKAHFYRPRKKPVSPGR